MKVPMQAPFEWKQSHRQSFDSPEIRFESANTQLLTSKENQSCEFSTSFTVYGQVNNDLHRKQDAKYATQLVSSIFLSNLEFYKFPTTIIIHKFLFHTPQLLFLKSPTVKFIPTKRLFGSIGYCILDFKENFPKYPG